MLSRNILLLTNASVPRWQFHVCGNTWSHLNDLLDSDDAIGTLAAWIVAIGCEFQALPVNDDRDSLMDYGLTRLAAEFAGCTEAELDELEGLAYEPAMNGILELSRRMAGAC